MLDYSETSAVLHADERTEYFEIDTNSKPHEYSSTKQLCTDNWWARLQDAVSNICATKT